MVGSTLGVHLFRAPCISTVDRVVLCGTSSPLSVQDTPGFTLGQKIEGKCGMRASMTAELVFDGVEASHIGWLIPSGLLLIILRASVFTLDALP